MKLAIVGSSHLNEPQAEKIRDRIRGLLIAYHHDYELEIVTGDAKGVDTIAQQEAERLGLKVKVFQSNVKNWSSVGGFRERNLKIVDECDELICFAVKYGLQDLCYHHVPNNVEYHSRTGGCWTMEKAKGKLKSTQLILI